MECLWCLWQTLKKSSWRWLPNLPGQHIMPLSQVFWVIYSRFCNYEGIPEKMNKLLKQFTRLDIDVITQKKATMKAPCDHPILFWKAWQISQSMVNMIWAEFGTLFDFEAKYSTNMRSGLNENITITRQNFAPQKKPFIKYFWCTWTCVYMFPPKYYTYIWCKRIEFITMPPTFLTKKTFFFPSYFFPKPIY